MRNVRPFNQVLVLPTVWPDAGLAPQLRELHIGSQLVSEPEVPLEVEVDVRLPRRVLPRLIS